MVHRLTSAAQRRIVSLVMSFANGYLGVLGGAAAVGTGELVHWLWRSLWTP